MGLCPGLLVVSASPPAHEAHVLHLAPPALASTAEAQRGAGEAEGPARANTAPVYGQRK